MHIVFDVAASPWTTEHSPFDRWFLAAAITAVVLGIVGAASLAGVRTKPRIRPVLSAPATPPPATHGLNELPAMERAMSPTTRSPVAPPAVAPPGERPVERPREETAPVDERYEAPDPREHHGPE